MLGIGLTGTRGVMLAWFVMMGVSLILIRRSRLGYWRHIFWLCLGCLSCLAVVVYMTSAYKRFEIMFSNDASVINRIEIWSAASKIISCNPFGIGHGESGNFYSQWFQPFNGSYSYTGVLNSYLEIAVEYGIATWLLGLFFFSLVLFPVLAGYGGTETQKASKFISPMATCAAVSLLGIAVCGLTSSVHVYAAIRIISLMDLCMLIIYFFTYWRSMRLRSVFLGAGICSFVMLLGMVVWWGFTAGTNTVEARLERDGMVALRWLPKGTTGVENRQLLVFPDRAELGVLHGQKLRALLLSNDRYAEFLILDPRKPVPRSLPAANYDVAVFGDAVEWLPHLAIPGVKRWLIVHPRGVYYEAPQRAAMTVWLPRFDSTDRDAPWRIRRDGIVYHETASCGGIVSMDDIKIIGGLLNL
ncbi:O-antigen ligase family protein [Termitidicoccus mucosus]